MVFGRRNPRDGSVIILPPVAHAAAAAAAPEVVVESRHAPPHVDPWAWVTRVAAVAGLVRFVHDAVGWLSFRRQPAA